LRYSYYKIYYTLVYNFFHSFWTSIIIVQILLKQYFKIRENYSFNFESIRNPLEQVISFGYLFYFKVNNCSVTKLFLSIKKSTVQNAFLGNFQVVLKKQYWQSLIPNALTLLCWNIVECWKIKIILIVKRKNVGLRKNLTLWHEICIKCTLEWLAHLNYVKFCLSLRFVFFCTL
jgi:hypothetical protein